MRYRILEGKSRYRNRKGGFRIERQVFFFFWVAVDANDKTFHFEHFSHGNDYVWYASIDEAKEAISRWMNGRIKRQEFLKQLKPTVVAYVDGDKR